MFLVMGLVLALAQQPANAPVRGDLSIEGTIRDASGALLPGVLVLLRIPDRPFRVTFTAEAGEYRLASLSPGEYELFMLLPGFVTLKSSVALTGALKHDGILEVNSVDTCACVTAAPDPTIPDRLQSAMSRLRRVAFRMEDLKPDAALDGQRRELLNDIRWLDFNAVPELGDALREPNQQVRLNAAVLLYDLSSGSSDRKPVDISALFFLLARAGMDSDATLSEYARTTLEGALKEFREPSPFPQLGLPRK